MSEHTSNTTSGPDGEEWERAVGAARTLLSSDCGWLELFTRAILEEKGVPYGKGLPNPEAPHIPEDKEIEEETMPGQGEPDADRTRGAGRPARGGTHPIRDSGRCRGNRQRLREPAGRRNGP